MKKFPIYMTTGIAVLLLLGVAIWYNSDKKDEDEESLLPAIAEAEPFEGYDFDRVMNTIEAHDEQDTIIGNFTGNGLDTLYVRCVENPDAQRTDSIFEERFKWFLASDNAKIPTLELYGYNLVSPKLVNEGDLDGNGTCEVGYLHTWMNSQWRYYRILTLVDGEWKYLVSGAFLETPEWFRHSGVEVAEPGKEKGTILIHHYRETYDEKTGEHDFIIVDTIVKPTFDDIRDNE